MYKLRNTGLCNNLYWFMLQGINNAENCCVLIELQ